MLTPAFSVGLWTILFWIFVGIAIGGLIAWFLGQSARTETSTHGLASLDGRHAAVRAEFTHPVDQLEAIEGLTPQVAAELHKNGVHRFGQVAAMTPEGIAKMLAVSGGTLAAVHTFSWPFQARLLEHGRLAEFLALRRRVVDDRLPLAGLAGINDAEAGRLSAAGFGSVEALAAASPATVSAKLSEQGDPVATPRVAEWIDEAKSLFTGDFAKLAGFFGLPAGALAARSAGTWTETREVRGPLVNAHALLGETETTTAVRGPSLLPFWIGVIGAILLLLLCLLHIWCPWMRAEERVEPVMPAVATGAVDTNPAGAGVRSQVRDGRPLLVVFFDTAKSDVSNELSAESAKLKDYLASHSEARLSVSGYNDPRGDAAFNAELSKNRARNVAAALVAAGLPKDRIDTDKPLDTTPGEGSLAADRKVEVTIKEPGDVGIKPTTDLAPPVTSK